MGFNCARLFAVIVGSPITNAQPEATPSAHKNARCQRLVHVVGQKAAVFGGSTDLLQGVGFWPFSTQFSKALNRGG